MLRAVLSGIVVFLILLILAGLIGNVGPGELLVMVAIAVAVAVVVRRRRRV